MSAVFLTMLSQVSQVTESLYISSCYVLKPERLKQLGVNFVVNCTVEVPSIRDSQIATVQVHINDSPFANLKMYFDRITDRISDTIAKGGKTLVHCVAGVSRSATMVLAYLMKHQNMTLKEAYYFLKHKRPIIRPNIGFWRQLIQYETKIFGTSTVRIVDSAMGPVPDVYTEEPRTLLWSTPINAFPTQLPHSSSSPALNYTTLSNTSSIRDTKVAYGTGTLNATRTKEPSSFTASSSSTASSTATSTSTMQLPSSGHRSAQPSNAGRGLQVYSLPTDLNNRGARLRTSYSPSVPSSLSVVGRSKTAQKDFRAAPTDPRSSTLTRLTFT